ncbi:solute carrier family 35 member F5-like isoform X3 [Artemia franciscana]|uniref:solute carrier family 35 member F5-like isoform X3 n=1 Tax=Artemia franciscana TaxID=6661 RepID=UPI0032DA419B
MTRWLETAIEKYRFVFGLFILFIVDLIWVLSSELTKFIYQDADYNKPFFTTYFKTALFSLYLLGFLWKKSWRKMCTAPTLEYEPSQDIADEHANLDSLGVSRFSVREVSSLAITFCLLWFIGNYSYQAALSDTEAGIVNVLSSSSSLFTLIFAAFLPSSTLDRFTLSKLVAVILSIIGVALVSYSDLKIEKGFPVGAIWSLVGAVSYAGYLVVFKYKVNDESALDIRMFFGFVGLMNTIILWPGFFLLHFSGEESFQLPNRNQFLYILVNGLVGTVVSEALWLWGCFLTSSLVGTLAMSLTIPLSMLADGIVKGIDYSFLFYIGAIPLLFAFVAVTVLSKFDNADPVGDWIKRICCRKLENTDRDKVKHESEQREFLLSESDSAL